MLFSCKVSVFSEVGCVWFVRSFVFLSEILCANMSVCFDPVFPFDNAFISEIGKFGDRLIVSYRSILHEWSVSELEHRSKWVNEPRKNNHRIYVLRLKPLQENRMNGVLVCVCMRE